MQGSCAGKRLLVVFAYRSDKHAAVLTLQRTQRKDRRAYDGPYRNPYSPAARRKGKAPGRARGTNKAAGIKGLGIATWGIVIINSCLKIIVDIVGVVIKCW